MRRIGIGLFALSMMAIAPAHAGKSKPAAKPPAAAAPVPAGDKTAETKPAEAKPAEAKPADVKPADAKPADAKPADGVAKPKPDSLTDLLEKAGESAAVKAKEDDEAKAAAAKAAAETKKKEEAKRLEDARKQAAKVGPKIVPQGAVVDAPPPTGTDDNDASPEAAKVAKLEAVKQEKQKHRGPYQLGQLDCRTLDGAGIERVLPGQIVAGEEPDILCRVVVTQPGDIVSEEHSLTLSVLVGGKETWKQTRKVRMSNIGRRSLVFVIPMDKISSDDPTTVTMSAVLSPPADPGAGRVVKFKVEALD